MTRSLVRLQQEIDGLSGRYRDVIGRERLHVASVRSDDRDVMIGDPEEHDVVHDGVDHTE